MNQTSTQTASPLADQTVADFARGESKASTIKLYYELTKPGITQMVALSALAAYYLALQIDVVSYAGSVANWIHFTLTMLGTVAVSAGSCVFNHIVEREADLKMKRTASRPIPAGIISVRNAIVFGVALSVIGLVMLAFINVLTICLAVATWLLYVLVYTPLKKKSQWALIVGSFPGALPILGGWAAVRGSIGLEAWVLFAILFVWQIPHFLALSWMYKGDYREGGFVLRSGTDESGRVVAGQTLVSTIVTAGLCIGLWLANATGSLYMVGTALLGIWMTIEAFRFFSDRTVLRARKVLLTSYALLMGVYILVMIDKV